MAFSPKYFVLLALLLATSCPLAYGQDEPGSTPTSDPGDDSADAVDIDIPPTDRFLRRAYGKAVVIGDYIYLEGGQISVNNTDKERYAVNVTLSINLTESWTPEDVKFIETKYDSKAKQPLLDQILIPETEPDDDDDTQRSFYSWAGAAPEGEEIRSSPELWKFQTDGKGSGRWINATREEDSDFQSTPRVRDAAVATFPVDGRGYIFGGRSTRETMAEPLGYSRGWLGFTAEFVNSSTGRSSWTKIDEEVPYSPEDRHIVGGSAMFVDAFSHGLIFVLGGYENFNDTGSGIDFSTVYFRPPFNTSWYSQKTTGNMPTNYRSNFCAVGVAASYGSDRSAGNFDIFVFGGHNLDEETDYSDVYVLTLPAFHWELAASADPKLRRSHHDCAIVGNRQMMSWGGRMIYDTDDDTDGWGTKDPFPQGIGIFDMSAFEWKDRYDANADAYEQNDKLKEINDRYYTTNIEKVDWESDEVRDLFFLPGQERFFNDREMSTQDKNEKDTPVGAIAGGVVGGVALLTLIAATWFFWRRRQRRQKPELPPRHDPGTELDPKAEIVEAPPQFPEALGDGSDAWELQGGRVPAELAAQTPKVGQGPFEMPGESQIGRS